MRRRASFGFFIVWTVFVWGNRISNALNSDESTGGKIFSVVLSLVMLAFALSVALIWVRQRFTQLSESMVRVITAAGVVTVLVWLVRIPQIALGDHDAGFIIVHALLGVISIVISVFMVRRARADLEPLFPVPPVERAGN